VLEHAGLVGALADHCAALTNRQIAEVSFSAEGDFTGAGPDTALCLYRVTQEALRNVVTHAGPCRAEVRLKRTGCVAELTISDDGRGFDVMPASKSARGLGLVSISERVRLARGTVSVVSEMRKGTRVRVEIPVEQRAVRAAAGESEPYATSA
jgi:two-component system sensor histidine kinase UhpB